MTDARSTLCARLRHDAVRRGRFTLASGRTSDFLIDCKRVVLTAEGHRLVGEVLCDLLVADGLDVDAVAGVALGGCPLASAVSLTAALRGLGSGGRGWDAVYVRKSAKEYGSGAAVEGLHPPDGRPLRVCLLEDVLTTGASSLRAIAALREAGVDVVALRALVDRGEGALDALAAAGVDARAVYRREDLGA